jgi:sporulation killing factor system radical SAM maturase
MELSQKDVSAGDTTEFDLQQQQTNNLNHKPNWAVHLQPCGGLLVEKNSKFYLRLSGLALKLALQLTRTKSFPSTVAIRSILDKQPIENVRDELLDALSAHPFTASWLEGSLGHNLTLSGSSESFMPLTATLQLTNACNLNCSFCYASSGDSFNHELNSSQWINLIEKLSIGGLMSVTLSGGEPTISRGFPQILEAASALVNTVDVFTNGLAWSDRTVKLVAALGNVRCQVSVDGLEDNHDLLRGRKGSYQLALNTIRRLSDAGVHVMTAMTVTPDNYKDLEKVIIELDNAGAKEFRAGKAVTEGRNKNGKAVINDLQFENVIQQFSNIAYIELNGLQVKEWNTCDSGINKDFQQTELPFEFITPGYINWYIRADGFVAPCQVEKLMLGHVLKQPLSELGKPENLAKICRGGKICQCLPKVNIPTDVDLPF